MSRILAADPQPLAHFTCPTCGQTAVSGAEAHPTEGLVVGNYLCPTDHVFTVRWMESA